MPQPPPGDFTHYWANKTWDHERSTDDGHALAHTAGGQFRERGVRPGDLVYVVTNQDGQMMLAGRMRVARICALEEARGSLDREPWEAPDQVLGTDGTVMDFDQVVPGDVVRRLRLLPEGVPLLFAGDRLDQQTLRGIRELTAESARLPDEYLKPHADSALELVASEGALARSWRRGRLYRPASTRFTLTGRCGWPIVEALRRDRQIR